DPAALKKKVAELQKQLGQRPKTEPVPDRFEEGKDAGRAEAVKLFLPYLRSLGADADLVRDKAEGFANELRRVIGEAEKLPGVLLNPLPSSAVAKRVSDIPKTTPARPTTTEALPMKHAATAARIVTDGAPSALAKAERLILTALAQHGRCSK